MNEESIGKIIEMWTAQDAYHGVGMVVGYADHPTIVVRTPDGRQVSWAAHLCRHTALSKQAGDELLPAGDRKAGK